MAWCFPLPPERAVSRPRAPGALGTWVPLPGGWAHSSLSVLPSRVMSARSARRKGVTPGSGRVGSDAEHSLGTTNFLASFRDSAKAFPPRVADCVDKARPEALPPTTDLKFLLFYRRECSKSFVLSN